jgi:hypothetical protein
MKIWCPKSRVYLLKQYPSDALLITTSKMDDYVLYVFILLNNLKNSNRNDIKNKTYNESQTVLTCNFNDKINKITKIMRILYSRGANVILSLLNNAKYQNLISVVLKKIKDIQIEVAKICCCDQNLKKELFHVTNNLRDLIKKQLLDINIIDDVKNNIFEFCY